MRAAATVTALVAAGLTVSAPNAQAETRCTMRDVPPTHIMSTANGLCVSIELGWQGGRHGTLRARATAHSDWERIEFLPSEDPDFSKRSCLWQVPAGWTCSGRGHIALKEPYGDPTRKRFVEARWSMNPSAHGILRLSPTIRPVYSFNCADTFDRLVRNDGSGTVALRSCTNGMFVSAELGWDGDDYGTLRARATTIGAWEEFKWVHAPWCVDFRSICWFP